MTPVYVLIGGASRRFGVDKAAHPVDGEPWALQVAGRLGGGDPTLVGRRPNGGPLAAVRCVGDATDAVGPMAGLLAALRDREERLGPGLLTLASCDLVRPEAAWLEPLLAAHAADSTLEAAAYAAAERWQPFPCVVHTRWLETLPADAASLQAAFGAARAARIAWRGSPGGPPQANTPEELARRLAEGTPR